MPVWRQHDSRTGSKARIKRYSTNMAIEFRGVRFAAVARSDDFSSQ